MQKISGYPLFFCIKNAEDKRVPAFSPFLENIVSLYHGLYGVARFGWDFCGIYTKNLREWQKSLPFQGRWLGGTPRRRGCSRFATTSPSPSVTAPLRGEPRGAARPVAFPYEGKVARRKP